MPPGHLGKGTCKAPDPDPALTWQGWPRFVPRISEKTGGSVRGSRGVVWRGHLQ